MKNAISIISAATFIVALLTLLASVTSWFKQSIPIQFGFLKNDEILQQIDLSTGDPAKLIFLRFHNSGKGTLTGVTLYIQIYRPLALSGTEHAVGLILGKTTYEGLPFIILEGNTNPKTTTVYGGIYSRGPSLDNGYYVIRLSELVMAGNEHMDVRVQLNAQNVTPGTYKVDVRISSTRQDYNDKQASLSISMK